MKKPILFYFDFASPYAYFALDGIERLAESHGRTVEWRPILVWALLKAHGIAPPLEVPVKRAYFEADMKRSAAFHGISDYRHPGRLPVSSHRAARLFYDLQTRDAALARSLGREAFRAFFTRDEDISDEDTLVRVASRVGIDPSAARNGMNGETGRAALGAMIDTAVSEGVCGSPWFIIDGEAFFGVDRLPQISWRLETA
jgi:2-hydroxychromene-2-carboxylate isomerase